MTTNPEPTNAEQMPMPEEGQRYVHRADQRTVTVTSVWTAADDTVGVAYEWGDRGQCGSACPLDVFHRIYEPELAPAPDPATTVRFILDRLDRHKELTDTELRSLRSCIADLQAAVTVCRDDAETNAARAERAETALAQARATATEGARAEGHSDHLALGDEQPAPPPTAAPHPRVQPTEYEVNCLPEDGIDSHVFGLTVRYRGEGRWAVQRGEHACLGADGEWADGVKPYDRGETWLNSHRFDHDTALRLAKEHAPKVTVNGYTVTDALAMREQATDPDRS